MFAAGPTHHSDGEAARRRTELADSPRQAAVAGEYLPLDAEPETAFRGWRIRLPMRADQITLEKQTIVAERVVVRVRPREEVVQVTDTVQREELRVETRGNLRSRRARGRARTARRSSSPSE